MFLSATFNGISRGLISSGFICLIISGIFAFLAFRSTKVSIAPSNSIKENETSAIQPTVVSPSTDISKQKPHQTNYVFASIKVTGVTFNNDDGTSRQLILRKLHFKDSPFEEYVDVGIKQYEFNGQLAYGVYANDIQIGNIPSDLVSFVHENIERIESISYIDVYGGGKRDGKPMSYGCKITLRFMKDNPPINVPSNLKIND